MVAGLAADFLFGYTGRFYDQATGLQWNLNRWYDPSVGKWLSEDPSGLAAGANPYEYVGDAPTDGTDPSGLVIEISCKAREYLTKLVLDLYDDITGIQIPQDYEFPNPAPPQFHVASGTDVWEPKPGTTLGYRKDGGTEEILATMIKSPRRFVVKGDSTHDAIYNLELQINARKAVVAATSAIKFGFKTGLPDVRKDGPWAVETVPGQPNNYNLHHRNGNPDSALADLSDIATGIDSATGNSPYNFGCNAGAQLVMLYGISQALGSGFNEYAKSHNFINGEGNLNPGFEQIKVGTSDRIGDWVPGDWGYIENSSPDPAPGEEGENIIYLGADNYWGHGLGADAGVKPLQGAESWYEVVQGWGKAYITDARISPSLGLVTIVGAG